MSLPAVRSPAIPSKKKSTYLFSSFKILRNFSALVWPLLVLTCSFASASSRRRIDFFTVTRQSKAWQRQAGKSPQKQIQKQTHHDPKHAAETPKPHSAIYSVMCRSEERREEKENQRFEKDLRTKRTQNGQQNDGEICGESRVYQKESGMIRQQGSWYRSRWCREVQAENWDSVCCFRVSTLPYMDRGHAAHRCPGEEEGSVALCGSFLLPPQGRWRDRGSWRVKRQSPGVTDTHTPKHFISITNHSVGSKTHTRNLAMCGSGVTEIVFHSLSKISWWEAGERKGDMWHLNSNTSKLYFISLYSFCPNF